MRRDKRRVRFFPGWVTVLIVSLPVAGIAQLGTQKTSLQELSTLERLQASQKPEAAVPLGATVNPASYVVGAYDVLALNIWITPQMQYPLEVTPEGSIIIPSVGEFRIAGMTLEEVKTRVVAAVKKRFIASDVTLTLLRPRPVLVTIQGSILHNGQYTLSATDRADRALQMANVPRTTGESQTLEIVEQKMSRRHILVRHLDGTTSKADIVRFHATGKDADNPYLREGDVIVVPEKARGSGEFAVYGEVNAPGRFEHVAGDRFIDALRMAQGFSDYANTDSVEISRLSEDGRSMTFRSAAVDRDSFATPDNFAILPGDRILVRKHRDARADYRVFVDGEVIHPGTYPITKDRTKLTEVIRLAGGFTEFASLKSAELSRSSIDPQEIEMDRIMSFRGGISPDDSLDYLLETDLRLRKEIVSVDFDKLFNKGDSTQDVYLQTEDVIKIPPIAKTIYVFGQIISPGHIPFKSGEDPSYYIGLAGGFTESARRDDIRIIKSRTKQWLAPEETTVQEGDYIWVPKDPDRSFAYYMTIASQAASVMSVIIGMAAVIISLSN